MNALFPDDVAKVRAMGSHQSANAETHTWLTPPFILKALGPFDLDPCAAPEPRPWPTAALHWTRQDNSLGRQWSGRVWLNPPYGVKATIGPWMRRMAEHGHGTALIFARTETAVFFETVWGKASAVLFLKGRLCFHRRDGSLPSNAAGGGNAGAPSVLIAYGQGDADALSASGLAGHFLKIR